MIALVFSVGEGWEEYGVLMLKQAKNKYCVFKRLMERIYFCCILWFLFQYAIGVSDHIAFMVEWLFER